MASNAVVITGIRDIDRRLKLLPLRLQKKVIRKAVRDGMKVMAAEVKSRAPVDKGVMRKAVKVRAVKSRKRGDIAIETTISGKVAGLVKFTSAGKRVFYPAAVEYGRKGEPPNPFMRRAFEAKGEAARQVTIESIRKGLDREVSALSSGSSGGGGPASSGGNAASSGAPRARDSKGRFI